MAARKKFLRKVGEEHPLVAGDGAASREEAICWSYGRTLANIAVLSPVMLGHFPSSEGADATLPCEFVNAGKFRHGAHRWWCRTHQTHWGTKADQRASAESSVMVCANHEQSMNYVVRPFELNVDDYDQVAVTCKLPPAISTRDVAARPPTIRLVLSKRGRSDATSDHAALSLVYQNRLALFGSDEIARVNMTPPAVLEFVLALDSGRSMSCIDCSHCGYPHLDLGDFARKPHRKHFCANCGRDSTWSREPIVSTPLKPLHDQLSIGAKSVPASGAIELSDYDGCDYAVWATTPAALWTRSEPQVRGIRVEVTKGVRTLVDEVFSDVRINGKRLERGDLLSATLARTII